MSVIPQTLKHRYRFRNRIKTRKIAYDNQKQVSRNALSTWQHLFNAALKQTHAWLPHHTLKLHCYPVKKTDAHEILLSWLNKTQLLSSKPALTLSHPNTAFPFPTAFGIAFPLPSPRKQVLGLLGLPKGLPKLPKAYPRKTQQSRVPLGDVGEVGQLKIKPGVTKKNFQKPSVFSNSKALTKNPRETQRSRVSLGTLDYTKKLGNPGEEGITPQINLKLGLPNKPGVFKPVKPPGLPKGALFGKFTLIFKTHGKLSAKFIQTVRLDITKTVKKKSRFWLRLCADTPVTARPVEARMGKGKGSIQTWEAAVKPGQVCFEFHGLNQIKANQILNALRKKSPSALKLCLG